MAAEIDLTLFGNRMYFGFKFDLKNPFRSISSAGDGSLYRYKQGVRQLRTELTYNPYDRPNPFADFDLTGKLDSSVALYIFFFSNLQNFNYYSIHCK